MKTTEEKILTELRRIYKEVKELRGIQQDMWIHMLDWRTYDTKD